MVLMSLYYDAAVMADVAKSKAPTHLLQVKQLCLSSNLSTGNTTYKAVQRSADLVSIGPMLQGMRNLFNDLSRGALVNDIVYTVALTLQFKQANKKILSEFTLLNYKNRLSLAFL